MFWPTASTCPAMSTPGILIFGLRSPHSKRIKNGLPLMRHQSQSFTDAASTFIKTSSSLGVGVSTSLSSRTSGEPYFVKTIAFMIIFIESLLRVAHNNIPKGLAKPNRSDLPVLMPTGIDQILLQRRPSGQLEAGHTVCMFSTLLMTASQSLATSFTLSMRNRKVLVFNTSGTSKSGGTNGYGDAANDVTGLAEKPTNMDTSKRAIGFIARPDHDAVADCVRLRE